MHSEIGMEKIDLIRIVANTDAIQEFYIFRFRREVTLISYQTKLTIEICVEYDSENIYGCDVSIKQ